MTSSRRELIKLCHSEAIRSSPFFNIFANINVSLFTGNEARELIETSLAGTGVEFSEDIVQMIFSVAGFHPYFLQVACYHAFETYRRPMSALDRAQIIAGKLYREAGGVDLFSFFPNLSATFKPALMRLLSRLLNSDWALPTSPPISTSTEDDSLAAMRWAVSSGGELGNRAN